MTTSIIATTRFEELRHTVRLELDGWQRVLDQLPCRTEIPAPCAVDLVREVSRVHFRSWHFFRDLNLIAEVPAADGDPKPYVKIDPREVAEELADQLNAIVGCIDYRARFRGSVTGRELGSGDLFNDDQFERGRPEGKVAKLAIEIARLRAHEADLMKFDLIELHVLMPDLWELAEEVVAPLRNILQVAGHPANDRHYYCDPKVIPRDRVKIVEELCENDNRASEILDTMRDKPSGNSADMIAASLTRAIDAAKERIVRVNESRFDQLNLSFRTVVGWQFEFLNPVLEAIDYIDNSARFSKPFDQNFQFRSVMVFIKQTALYIDAMESRGYDEAGFFPDDIVASALEMVCAAETVLGRLREVMEAAAMEQAEVEGAG